MAPWSSLRALGQSRLLSLTVLAPFIGTLILFNEQVINWLLLTPTLAGYPSMATDDAKNASRAFTLSRLEITYFGLVFLGLGSFIFQISCPNEIKTYSSVVDYIDREKPLLTKSRIGLLVTTLARTYLNNHGREEQRGSKLMQTMAYPDDSINLFEAIFDKIASSIDLDEDVKSPAEDPEFLHSMWSMNGNIMVENVARRVAAQRKVERAFWQSFHAEAHRYVVDMATLRYMNLDRSKPSFRLIIAVCYSTGFSILFFPTVKTFFSIAGGVVGVR